jgi:YesN/AraC family two-component response regulator
MLWADLRTGPRQPDLCGSLPKSYAAQRVITIADLFLGIQNWLPWVICFEYDHPDARGLEALTETRRRYCSVPVVMLTQQHSEALAQWALGCCVWDYLVKPVSVRRLCNCLTSVQQAAPPSIANSTALVGEAHGSSAVSVIGPAVSYVKRNYSEKLHLATAARLCDLSPFQFSRNFKKENGFTFRDFVVRVRIQRAAELIKQSKVSITDAAFGVGFNDLSYFARMFRRQIGVSPSHYREMREAEQLLLFPLTDPRQR